MENEKTYGRIRITLVRAARVLLTAILIMGLAPTSALAQTMQQQSVSQLQSSSAFPDVSDPSVWYYSTVYRAADEGLVAGYATGYFGPSDTLTRAQAATILWRYYEPEAAVAYDSAMANTVNTTGMLDVDDGAFYTAAANWAVKNEVINGYDDGRFDPNGNITREQLCTIVSNASAALGSGGKAADFTALSSMPDASSVSAWAEGSVAWALANSIISGREENGQRLVVPGGIVTRAEMTAILMSAIDANVLGGRGFNSLSVDERNFVRGEGGIATFTISAPRGTEISLEGNGRSVPMHDDGTNGDKTANDGEYTVCVDANTLTLTETLFHATDGSRQTTETGLYLFKPTSELTENEVVEQGNAISNVIAASEAPYLNGEGYVAATDASAVLETLAQELSALKTSGDVVNYQVDKDGAYIKLACGVAMVYNPPIEDTLGSIGNASMGVWAYQPFEDIYTDTYESLIRDSLRTPEFLNSGSNWGWANFENVTHDTFSNLPNNSLIFWNGHGGYSEETGPTLFTSESVSLISPVTWGSLLRSELIDDEIVYGQGSGVNVYVGVTPKYISKHCSDLSGDVFMCGSCHGCQNSRLADALIAKGAVTVLGFDDTVHSGYAAAILYGTSLRMCESDVTIAQALAAAENDYGPMDCAFYSKQGLKDTERLDTSPVLYGDTGKKFDTYLNGRNVNDTLRTNLESATSDPIREYYSGDFDHDGNNEAFAITSSLEPANGIYSNATIWGVTEDGAERLFSSFGGFSNGMMYLDDYGFLSLSNYANGSGGSARVYGYKNSVFKQMSFVGTASLHSASYPGWNSCVVENSGKSYVRNITSCWELGYHTYVYLFYSLDEANFRFKFMGFGEDHVQPA